MQQWLEIPEDMEATDAGAILRRLIFVDFSEPVVPLELVEEAKVDRREDLLARWVVGSTSGTLPRVSPKLRINSTLLFAGAWGASICMPTGEIARAILCICFLVPCFSCFQRISTS